MIEQEPTGLWISFPFAPEVVQQTEAAETEGKTGEKSSGESSGEIGPKSSPTVVGPTARRLLRLLRDTPQITIPEMASQIGITERAIEKQIRKLREQDRIIRIGPTKGGQWKVCE